jgi:hypothetical protein
MKANRLRLRKMLTQAAKAWAPRGQIDAFTLKRAVGWALGGTQVEIQAWLDDRLLARSLPDQARPDVAAAYPQMPLASQSGFSIDFPENAVANNDIAEFRIVARPLQAWWPSSTIARFVVAGSGVEGAVKNAPESAILGPFPRQIINAIASLWPEDCSDLSSSEGQRRFVKRLRQLLAAPNLGSLPVLADYARYLSATLAHCRFVERHFPSTNAQAANGAADFHCKPNSVRELFAIIHQLYVLKSWGVTGDFAEFGCFKGYSSAMLSFACQQLGVRMHIFDSFEGLPTAEGSGYQSGQYAGALDEVRDHVTRFGAIEAVEFHKGFFADTFRDWRPPNLMCLWMDVDLEASSQDLMVAADMMDPRASLFSHECPPDIFEDGEIITTAHPGNPIPPMLAHHVEVGRPLTGRFIAGYTGSFWPRDGGIPVADNEILWELIREL